MQPELVHVPSWLNPLLPIAPFSQESPVEEEQEAARFVLLKSVLSHEAPQLRLTVLVSHELSTQIPSAVGLPVEGELSHTAPALPESHWESSAMFAPAHSAASQPLNPVPHSSLLVLATMTEVAHVLAAHQPSLLYPLSPIAPASHALPAEHDPSIVPPLHVESVTVHAAVSVSHVVLAHTPFALGPLMAVESHILLLLQVHNSFPLPQVSDVPESSPLLINPVQHEPDAQ